MEQFTPRNVAKFSAKHVIGAMVGKAVKDILLSTIPATEKLKIAELSGAISAWYVSGKLEPVTDDLVDFAADEILEYRIKRHIAKHTA